MPLQVDFPSVPGAKPDDWVERLVQILTFIRDFSPTTRAFREWAATMGSWDKAETPKLLALFDAKTGPDDKLALGKWAGTLLQKPTLVAQKEEVFNFLFRANELLAKFVFVQLKERVHGTEPLYRLVSGFSYRGDKPALPSFTAWLSWVVACGLVRKIGVAWALTPKALAIYKVVESVDEDEIVAEIEAARKKAEEEAAAGGAGATGAPGSGAQPAAGGGAGADGDDLDEDGPDVPDAPPAPAPRRAEGGAAAPAGVAVPRILAPVQFRAIEHPPLPVDDGELSRTLGRLMELWRSRPPGALPGVPRAADVGLTAGEYKGTKKPWFLFRLACLGAIHYRARLAPEASVAAWRALDREGVFRALFLDGVPLEQALGERGWFVQNDLERAASRALLDVLPLRAALRDAGAKGLKEIEAAESGAQLLDLLAAASGNALDLELFFLAREMHDLGLWGAAAAELATVPDRPLRDQAFRLGFIDSPYAHDLGELRDAAERLQRWFGRGEIFGLPLLALERAYGCTYRCPRADTCEYTCRERFELGRK